MTNLEITLIVLLIFAITIIVLDYFRKEDLASCLRWEENRLKTTLQDLDVSRTDYNRLLVKKQKSVSDLQKIRNIATGKGSSDEQI